MALHIRRVGEVGDGAVTPEKLADGAVDLGTPKVVGELPTEKLEDAAITEAKIKNLEISTGKLKDNVITLAKADDDIKLNTYLGDETEILTIGVTPVLHKTFKMSKHMGKYMPAKFRAICALKTSDVLHAATLEIKFNDEADARISLSTTSVDYELKSGECDISDLSAGRHSVDVYLKSADAGATAYNELIDIMLIK